MAKAPFRSLCAALLGLFCAAVLLWTGSAHAGQGAPAAVTPALELRVTQLAQELRCLVCQNQTIADSQAPLAVELKNQVREQLARGQSDQDVIDFMVQRYGDFVLYRPPVKASTWLLWFGPFLLLAFGLLALVLKLRQKPAAPADSLTAAELAHAAALLAGESPPDDSAPAARSIPAITTVANASTAATASTA